MKIAIFASIWAQNLWDELILKNEIKLLENEYGKNTQFFVFSYDYKNPFFIQDNIKYIEYFPIWIKNPKNILRNIYNFFVFLITIIKSDLIIIWWGWIIYDNEKQINKNPLRQWNFRTNIFRFFRKKINFFAIWLNIKNEKSLEQVKNIFYKSNKITVRDNYSFELLKKLNIESQIVKDPVFQDNWEYTQDKSYLIEQIKSYDFSINYLENIAFSWKKVWIALRKWYLSDKNGTLAEKMEEGKINEIINYILKNKWEIILLPHSFHNTDIQANDFELLNKFIWKKWVSITKTLEESYLNYKNSKIDLCLSMRLHSMILSQVYKIPFIWISYSKKTDELLEN